MTLHPGSGKWHVTDPGYAPGVQKGQSAVALLWAWPWGPSGLRGLVHTWCWRLTLRSELHHSLVVSGILQPLKPHLLPVDMEG